MAGGFGTISTGKRSSSTCTSATRVDLTLRSGSSTRRRRIVTGDLPTVTAEKFTVLQELQLITLTPSIQAERGIRSEHGALIFKISPQVSRATGLREGDVIVAINRNPVRTRRSGRTADRRPTRAGDPGVFRARRANLLHRSRLPMTDDDRWRSPLGTRYASPAMQSLWGEPHRIGLWRRLWLALAEAERELGLDIPDRRSPRCGRISTTPTSLRRPATSAASGTTSWPTSTRSASRPPPRGPSSTSAPPARSSPTTPTSSSCARGCACCSAG